MAGVASAAIIEGKLIIGLDDGSIIRAGYVQGPQGLKGDPGPIGATGDRGTDGNTIITIAGIPGNEIGKDGDYAINNRDWFIFGLQIRWYLGQRQINAAPSQRHGRQHPWHRRLWNGGGSGRRRRWWRRRWTRRPIFTNTVRLTDPTRTLLSTKEGYRVLPDPGAGKRTQQDASTNGHSAAYSTESTKQSPSQSAKTPDLEYVCGRLWFDSSEDDLTLYIYYGDEWIPAAPPVSLDGINYAYHRRRACINPKRSAGTCRVEGEIVQNRRSGQPHNSFKHKGPNPRRNRHRWQVVRPESNSNPREGGLRHYQRRTSSQSGDWSADFLRVH